MLKQTSRPSCFAIAALFIGLLNAFFLGFIAYELHSFAPLAQSVTPTVNMFKEHQAEISNALDFVASVSNATVRLFDGSLPSLLESFLNTDITSAAGYTENLAENVHKVTCIAGGTEQTEYPNKYLYWISRYSDLVRSVSNQVKRIPAGADSRIPQQGTEDAGPSKQSSEPFFPDLLTGEGGLLTETLKYATDYMDSQTNVEEWSVLSCKCQAWANLLLDYMIFKGTYGPECGYDGGFSKSWNVIDDARSTLEILETTCGQLCKMDEEKVSE